MSYIQLKISKYARIYLIFLFSLIIIFLPFIPFVSICLLLILFFVIYFFRDPNRVIPINENLILSPADGLITFIGPSPLPKEVSNHLNDFNKEFTKISIFLNVFDVHINRVPTSGKIISSNYVKGKFVSATLDKSSDNNERNITTLETKEKNYIIFVQIAGLIARRIICNLKQDQQVNIGDRFGIIKFGSRVDIYIPKNLNLHVAEGQKVIGGESVLADFRNTYNLGESIIK